MMDKHLNISGFSDDNDDELKGAVQESGPGWDVGWMVESL